MVKIVRRVGGWQVRGVPGLAEPRLEHLARGCGYRVAELSERLGCSGAHVRRVFSRDLGLPPKEWLRQERMVRARQSVVAGVPLAEVARQSGFARPAEFIREFRRTYGGSPGRRNSPSSIFPSLDCTPRAV